MPKYRRKGTNFQSKRHETIATPSPIVATTPSSVIRKHSGPKQSKQAPASLPIDLCQWSDVISGFGSLEPIATIADKLLLPTDATATPKLLAAESIAHLVEGWRYLAAAVSSLLTNSRHQTIHLAYYAELRAALSLFACTGIKVAKPRHEYLTSLGNSAFPSWEKKPTHQAVWEIWRDWVGGSSADQLFSDKLRIHPSVTLRAVSKCLNSFSPSKSLQLWGFDLVRLASDHDARNAASYQPMWTNTTLPLMQPQDVEFVTLLWQQLQPLSVGLQFELSYVHYLIDRDLIENRTQPDFDEVEWYESFANKLASETGAQEAELRMLLQDRSTSTQLFDYAGESQTEWQNVLSRALFLLRLASKSTEVAFSLNGHSSGKNWFRFWLQHAGIFDPASGATLTDLWDDYSDLPGMTVPTGLLPEAFRNSDRASNFAMRLSRPDASLAWSLGV